MRILNFEFWILNWETSGTGETSREVYTKEIAKCVYKQLDKPTNVEETLKILAEKMNNNQFTE